MAWRIGLFTLLVFWGAVAEARHGGGVLEPRRATPGISLELIEMSAGASPNTKKYQLRAKGIPRNIVFDVWTKDFGQPFKEAFSSFQMDESGVFVAVDGSRKGQRLEDIVVEPGPYPEGAVWMVALASHDHKLSAFAKIFPHPIVASDGACSLFLELISLHGNRFLASGTGFAPGEEVDVETRAAGRVSNRKLRVSAAGLLPPDVVMHGGVGPDFTARYAVKSRSCGPAIEYRWGDPAIGRR